MSSSSSPPSSCVAAVVFPGGGPSTRVFVRGLPDAAGCGDRCEEVELERAGLEEGVNSCTTSAGRDVKCQSTLKELRWYFNKFYHLGHRNHHLQPHLV